MKPGSLFPIDFLLCCRVDRPVGRRQKALRIAVEILKLVMAQAPQKGSKANETHANGNRDKKHNAAHPALPRSGSLKVGRSACQACQVPWPISELMYGEVTYGQPIGSDGLRLNFSYLRARTAPSGALKQLEIEGTSEEGSVALEYPLIRSRLENLRLGIRFAARHSKTESIGNTVLAADDLRVLSVGVTYDWFDAWRGINLVSIGASKGLDMLGASDRTDPNLSRAGGRADFTKLYGELSRLQDVGAGVSVLVAGAFQYTNEALLASEEFGAGGDRFGRGYDPSEISGDQGAGFSIEFRHDTDLNIPYVDSLQPYAFFDTAAVWDNEINAADRRTLASAGLGVRVEVADRFNGFIEIAQPIEPAVATRGDEDPRLFGGISVRF